MFYKNYYKIKTNLYVYEFVLDILKIANEITKIPGTVKKVIFYLQKASFFSSFKSLLGFRNPVINFLIQYFVR